MMITSRRRRLSGRSLIHSLCLVVYIGAIFLLSSFLYTQSRKLLYNKGAPNIMQENIHLRPAAYTTLAQCDRKPSGEFDCRDVRQKGTTPLRQAQLVMTRMLRIFDLIAKKHGIRYWLHRGTLIGAVRHSGHNPFDDDVDISLPRDDFEKFVKLGAKELPSDIFFQTERTDPHYSPPRQSGMLGKLRDTKSCYKYCLLTGCKHVDGLQIDMLVVEQDTQGNFLELFSDPRWFVRTFLKGPNVRKFEEIFPLQEKIFDGFPIPVPRAWNEILESMYGDYMKMPGDKSPGHVDTDPLRSCEETKNEI